MLSAQVDLELPRDPSAPGRARRALVEMLAEKLSRDQLDTVKLLATELVTNAVLHGHGAIVLQAQVTETLVRVDVIDEGSGFARGPAQRTFDAFGGWGLALVESEASGWGILDGATHVWFELGRSGARVVCS
jgi:anti-sigma regulatory factor (Ser/Thr protein kinase)